MNGNEGRYNQIWIDGVELVNVQSGDVSHAEEQVRKAIDSKGGWTTIRYEGGHYTIYVSPMTSIVANYVG